MKNCFSCALDTVGPILWQVTLPGSSVPTSVGSSTASFAKVAGNVLVLPMPGDYIRAGYTGLRTIYCSHGSQQYIAQLFSPGRSVWCLYVSMHIYYTDIIVMT